MLNACTLPPTLGCMNVFQGRVAGHAGRQRRVVCVRLRMAMDRSAEREESGGAVTLRRRTLSLSPARRPPTSSDTDDGRRAERPHTSVPGGGCCIIAFAAHLINAAAAIRCESDAPVGRFSRSSLACCGRKIEATTPARPPRAAPQCPARANIVCAVRGEFSRRRRLWYALFPTSIIAPGNLPPRELNRGRAISWTRFGNFVTNWIRWTQS